LSTIVVTGCAGFIGSHLAAALLARGDRVIRIDDFDPFYSQELKHENVRASGVTEFVRADIRDAAAVGEVFSRTRPDGVVHLAAKAGVRPSLADPVGYSHTNVLGTSVVLDRASRAGCSRVVIASSSSVYGNNRKTPFSESDPVDAPISPYAATKKACELIAHAHWAITRMPTACLRFFTVFGPRQRPDLAISLFMRKIAAGEPIDVFGDGSMSRDFTYIDDIVSGIVAAYDRIPEHGYRVWNLGSDRPVRLDDMVAAIGRTLGREPQIRRRPMQPGDVDRTWADLSRAGAELGYRPATAFEDGLARQWRAMSPAPVA